MSDDAGTARIDAVFSDHDVTGQRRNPCRASVEALGVSSVSVTLMSDRNSKPICASDERAWSLEDMQFTIGGGPNDEAYHRRSPVFAPDLEHTDRHRWPLFRPHALELGARGVFAFPLLVGSGCIGALTLYQEQAGPLTVDQLGDSFLVADAVSRSVLAIPERPFELSSSDLADAGAHRAAVHQATGVVATQLGIGADDAALRMRAHAYASNRPVAAVARDIVDRRLRLDDDRRAGVC